MPNKIFYAREIQPYEYGWIHLEYPVKWVIYQGNYIGPSNEPAQFTYSAPLITGAYDFICEYNVMIDKDEIHHYKLTRILYYENPHNQGLLSVELGTLYLNPDFTNLEILAISELDMQPYAEQLKFCALQVAKTCINELVTFVNNPSLNLAQAIDNCLAAYSQPVPIAPAVRPHPQAQQPHIQSRPNHSQTRQQRTQAQRIPEELRHQIAALNNKLTNISEQISLSQQESRVLLAKPEENLQTMVQPPLPQEHNVHIKLQLTKELLTSNDNLQVMPIQIAPNDTLPKQELELAIPNLITPPLVPKNQSTVVEKSMPAAPENIILQEPVTTPMYTIATASLKDAFNRSYEFFLAKKENMFKAALPMPTTTLTPSTLTINTSNLQNTKNNTLPNKPKAKKKAKNNAKTQNNHDLDFLKEDVTCKDKLLTWSFKACQAPKKLTQNLLSPEKNLTFSMLLAVNWLIFRIAEYNELVDPQELMEERRAFFKAGTTQYMLFALAANLIYVYWLQHANFAPNKVTKHKF